MDCSYCSRPVRGRSWRSRKGSCCSKMCALGVRRRIPARDQTCPRCRIVFRVLTTWKDTPIHCSRSCAQSLRASTHQWGEANPRWRGGHVLSYGPGWKVTKVRIRERDGVCRSCGKTPADNGRALDVHHIEPFRFSGDHSDGNLVALCRSCHMKADDHGRAGSAKFLRGPRITRPTKREIRRLKQLTRAAEARARRREARRRAFELRAGGSSLRGIAEAVGVSHQTVSNWLQRESG